MCDSILNRLAGLLLTFPDNERLFVLFGLLEIVRLEMLCVFSICEWGVLLSHQCSHHAGIHKSILDITFRTFEASSIWYNGVMDCIPLQMQSITQFTCTISIHPKYSADTDTAGGYLHICF